MNVAELSRADSIDLEASTISGLAREHGLRIACAESLTSGSIASALGRATQASEWFCGGVVAYSPSAKVEVLEVDPGPVVTQRCATQMAAGVRRLMSADLAVAVTGVGGPEAAEGKPPGTVMIAVSASDGEWVATHRFDGEPVDVVSRTTLHALARLREALER